MAHNLFGERFYSMRKPAWHGLGLVLDTEIGAADAFDRIGAYDVHLEDLQTAGGIPIPQKAIVRDRTSDDDQLQVFGVVGPDYNLVSPRDVVSLWDSAVKQPVETIGALGSGETLFVSTKLPTLDVNGDEVENYMLVVSPMTGNDALQIRVTPVRVVCQNTLIASKRASTETYRIVHDTRAKERLTKWLEEVYAKALKRMDDLNASFRAMATTPIDAEARGLVLEQVYTMPALPKQDVIESVYVERMRNYEYQVERMARRRGGAIELFEGKGHGLDRAPAAGSAWGLYNAVVEMEDYGGGGAPAAVAESALVGDRARAKERAFDACLELAKTHHR
jgi:phage/plasmid-like protein (TIGR03299 family)